LTYVSDNTNEGVTSAPLVFTPANWNVAQHVTVTGVDDGQDNGDVPYTVHVVVASDDSNYSGVLLNQITLINQASPGEGQRLTVRRIYKDVLGRDADSGGLTNWTSQIGSGLSGGGVAVGRLHSQEHRAILRDEV